VKQKTIIDIANKLKLSPSTVSRALHDHPDIKDSTIERVKRAAQQLHYAPNVIAQSLKNNRTTTIGVIVPEIRHDFFSSAISGIEEIAAKSGYTIILCQSNESYEREVINTNLLMQHRVAGVIASVSQNTKSGEHFRLLLQHNISLLFFDRVCDDIDADKVIIDDYTSSFNAVKYLIGRGRKKIAHFAGPTTLPICRKRMEGYLDALRDAGLPIDADLIAAGDLDESFGYNSMDVILRKNIVPDALFAVNDPVAIGAFQRIKEANLNIPDDIAVIGFSNNAITSMIHPTLTTIDQFPFEMGKKAGSMLLEIIDGKRMKSRTQIIETKLIIRESA
jgi:DNA-binding LacI/PurR family transcriptional regulator